MYNIQLSTSTYNSRRNLQREQFNSTLPNLLKTLPKEQELHCFLNISSFVST